MSESFYTLRNLRDNKNLVHPAVGVWNTPDIQEAHEMLMACREYLESLGLSSITRDFVVWDLTTNQEATSCNVTSTPV